MFIIFHAQEGTNFTAQEKEIDVSRVGGLNKSKLIFTFVPNPGNVCVDGVGWCIFSTRKALERVLHLQLLQRAISFL